MKKIAAFLFLFLVSIVGNAGATALMDIDEGLNVFTLGENTYTIVDRQDTPGSYDSGYFGYQGSSWSGFYIGTVTSINDKQPNLDDNEIKAMLADLISYYLDIDYTITQFDTVEANNFSPDSASAGSLLVSTADDGYTGTWSILGADSAVAVQFYLVKSANEFALYYLDPAAQEGLWTTAHLLTPNEKNVPTISHLTAVYNSVPVPEPATLLLFGTGLLGTGLITRRKLKK